MNSPPFPVSPSLDGYLLDTLMRGLMGHDRSPSGFLVYLHLYGEAGRRGAPAVRASHQSMAEATGVSKSAVRKAVRGLLERRLLRVHRNTVTAMPEYRVLRP